MDRVKNLSDALYSIAMDAVKLELIGAALNYDPAELGHDIDELHRFRKKLEVPQYGL